MFTEDDLLDYFNQLQAIEKKMCSIYQELRDRLTRPEYKDIFAQLAAEEEGHDRIIQNLKNRLLKSTG